MNLTDGAVEKIKDAIITTDSMDNPEDLLDYVNEFLKKEKESGRIDELVARFLGRSSYDTF